MELIYYKIKKIVEIFIVFFLTIFLVGHTVVEYIEFAVSEKQSLDIFFLKENNSLLVKVPFYLPYHVETNYNSNFLELIIYDGDFYRAMSKRFEKDTLFTWYQRENLTRQNIFEMIGEVSQNFDTKEQNSKNLLRILKHFPNEYYQNQICQTLYFWNFFISSCPLFPEEYFNSITVIPHTFPPEFDNLV